MDNNNSNHPRALLLFAILLLIVAGIVFLKRASDPRPATGADGSGAVAENGPVAVPDTTIAPEYEVALPDTAAPALVSDSILGKDKRPPQEAGYEDGYEKGMDDGATGKEHASYDESSGFPTAAERESYTRGYREGYAKGFEDGRQHKQFNIADQGRRE